MRAKNEYKFLAEAYQNVYRESATSLDNTFAIDSAVSPFEELFRGSWDEIVEYLGPEYEQELMSRKGELGANKFQVSEGDGIELDEHKSGRSTERPRFKYFVKRAEPLDPADDHSDVEAYRKARGIEMPSDEEGNALESILPTLEFKKVKKQAKEYQYAESSQNMPAMSYTVVQQQQPVVTVTSDGKETQNVAEPNDIIMSGPSREQYVVKSEKFPKLYDGKIGGVVIPEQGDRIVARVDNITEPITFKAPWGEDMILKRDDYLVKDPSGGYYRIAQKEYDETYNPI